MIKKLLLITILILTFSNCGSSKKVKTQNASTTKTAPKKLTKAERIVSYAKQFKGVRYKWGGTTKAGMDCSGLVYESFRAHGTYLPRISRDMAKKGKKVNLKDVKEGDLLFFRTKKRGGRKVNHVGLVTKANSKTIEFIHSTSSKGVIITKLSEDYWNKAFVEARSLLSN
ncbi:C40 family peptidase [Seonamhaeicola marinus]|uniref:NlpC/P60 family protein n=1 Tax=Seonamhaeicola marinus TaxID=1912246 RepID=A0A5D0J9C3_9FLAO|nr:C40 family peptidase [Seonamhaeicola marinus]TYA92344.1 NlpC/P60 family protein [Seonamhaeicola marinus]